MSAHATSTPRPSAAFRRTGHGLILAAILASTFTSTTHHPSLTYTGAPHRGSEVSRSLNRQPLPTHVTLTDAGVTTTFTSTAPTLTAALSARGVVLGPDDQITPAPDTALHAIPVNVTITRVHVTLATSESTTPHAVRTVDDPSTPTGTRHVQQVGSDGQTRTIYQVKMDSSGTELSRTLMLSATLSAPVDEVIATGTQAPATLTAPAPAPVDPGTARAAGAAAVAAHGWGPDQFACLDALWSRESGWSTTAGNRSSGAYGIPQALPASKMASAGADWLTNPATQISWGLGYITARYATPCAAWAHSQATNWY